MQTSIYVALSGQLALERRLATVAQNIANAGTIGFRAEGVHFSEIVSHVPQVPASFTASGDTHLSTAAGGLTKTGNPLDVAIRGGGWLAIETPSGVAYTRDGRLQVLESGELVSLNGYPVLDVGGAPILIDPAGGPVTVALDGMLTQSSRQIGAIGLFEVDASAPYTRFENSAIISSRPGTPILDFTANGLVAGFLEESNVSPVMEMTSLIRISRAFEALAAAADENGATLKSAIQVLSSRG